MNDNLIFMKIHENKGKKQDDMDDVDELDHMDEKNGLINSAKFFP